MSASGRKVIVVPVSLVASPRPSSVSGFPRSYAWVHLYPSRATATSRRSASALTTEPPPPCRPPDPLYPPPPPNLPPACRPASTTPAPGRFACLLAPPRPPAPPCLPV